MSNLQFEHPADQIVYFMKRIYDGGMTTTSGGNLSILDSDGNMWISPGGIDKGTLRREDIVCVKADGSIVGRHKPSSEYPFHRAIYRMRNDVRAILHAHPPALVSFSIAGRVPETASTPTIHAICGGVGFAPYDVPGSDGLGEKVGAEFRKGFQVILLENHGACVAGTDMLQAFERFETLDFAARMLTAATVLGTPSTLSGQQLAEAAGRCEMAEFTPQVRSSGELEARRCMAELMRRAYRQKLFTAAEGTVAVRLDGDRFLISPAKIDRAGATPGEMVLVAEGRREAGRIPCGMVDQIRSIFAAQPDLGAVIVANPPHLAAYGVAGVKFDPRVIPESYILLRELPAFPFGALAEAAAKISPRYPIVQVDSRCVISSGRNLLEAFDRLEVAEYSARATIAARNFGGMQPINEAQVADLVKAFHLIP